MQTNRIRAIALDLEKTLISSAMHNMPRPGLRDFLDYCHATFEKVFIYTTVSPEWYCRVVAQLQADPTNPVPEWFVEDLYVEWSRKGEKDLSLVPGYDAYEVLLVDDQEAYVKPDQLDQWIPIVEWDRDDWERGSDCELLRVQKCIDRKLI